MFVVLLTNRVHEARAKRPAKVISDVRADLADAAALAVTDYADGPMAMPAKFRADKAIDWNRPERHPRKPVRKHASAALHSKSSSKPSSSKSSSGKSSSSKTKASTSSRSKTTAKKPTAKSR
jgi:hypothetical protein